MGPRLVQKLYPSYVFIGWTLLLMGSSYILGLVLHELDFILGLIGAMATVPVTLILPGLYLAKLADPTSQRGRIDQWLGYGSMILGIFVSVLCLYGTLS